MLQIKVAEVLSALQQGGDDWRASVPDAVADRVVTERLFGYGEA